MVPGGPAGHCGRSACDDGGVLSAHDGDGGGACERESGVLGGSTAMCLSFHCQWEELDEEEVLGEWCLRGGERAGE